ncbi:MAG: serine/threonine-protein kinase [Pyrinomonadaceae bacterium]
MTDQIIGETLADKYRIEGNWRSDAVSKTYHALQVALDKPVTIKVLNSALAEYSDMAEALRTEARILSRISNSQILNVIDVGADKNGTPFLVLENAEGRSLREFIRDEGGSSLERAVSIVRQIADALTIAHSNEIVHGDLATDNILVAERGNADFVKVLDFGAVRDLDFDDEKTVVRSELPFYKAPEQLAGGGAADSRTDIYALGILLFEILTGKPPFVDENAVSLAQKHLRDIPPSLIAVRPDLPPQVEQVVQRALAKQPNQRFQTAAEFSDSLTNAVRGSIGGSLGYAANFENAEIRPTPPVTSQNGANNPYKTAFIVLIGIVTLSVFAIYLTGGFRNTPTTQANSDPNALPVQPLNPASSNGEDLSSAGLQPLGNSNLDPTIVSPGGVTPGGIAPPIGGGIPAGLYPGGGQTVVVPGNSNSIFMGDLNSNAGVAVNGNSNRNVNANLVVNGNSKPAANINAAPSPRPANSNTGGSNVTPTPTPTAAPSQKPSPRPMPKPTEAPVKPNSTEPISKAAPSGMN